MQRLSFAVASLLVALACAARAQGIEEKAQICAACHGNDGVPTQQSFPVPVIWGQQLGYLFFQLSDFMSGARKNEQMTPIVTGLERDDLMALAQYFSTKPWPNSRKPPQVHVAAQAHRADVSLVCSSCHQDGFKGEGMLPRLAGQNGGYLRKTMTDFRSGARGNNPGMTDLMRTMSEEDIAALASLLGGM